MDLRVFVDSARQTEYRPIDRQIEFHRSPAKFRCYAGGVGCGKTLAGAVEALKTMLQYPRSRGLVGRFTDGELRRTSWRELLTVIPPELIAYENKAELQVKLKNGSEAEGMHLQEEIKIRSMNLDWIWVDEATEIHEKMAQQLKYRLRHSVGPRRAWFTTNPDARCSWVYRQFVETPRANSAYFHGRSADAIFLPEDYLADIHETYDDEMANRFVEGIWGTFEGMVFPMFNRECHVIPWTAADIPADWPRYRGMDHGWSDPAVCVFAAAAPDGTLYVYDLFYRKHCTIDQICAEVLAMSEGQSFEWTVLDPRSASQHISTTGRRIGEHYVACGLPVTVPKRTDILPGLASLRKLLEVRTGIKHPTLGTWRGARLYICAHCRPLIQEMQDYRYEDGGGEVPMDKHNHAIDALRYLVTYGPRGTEKVQQPDHEAWVAHCLKEFGKKPAFPYGDVIGNERAVLN